MDRVYLDHHAASQVDPRVRAALAELDAAGAHWANPSSVHNEGQRSRRALERAREQIAAAIGAAPADVVLTGGGTEACNLAVLGSLPDGLRGQGGARAHVVTTAVEHPAVAEPVDELERAGRIVVTRLPVPEGAPPDAATLAAALTPETRLCAVQWVNHETGTIFPIAEYAAVCRAAQVPLFVDAIQGFGKLPLALETLGADLVALAAHKIGGVAGAGALWVRRSLALQPLLLGGSQERGRRAGTPDVRAQLGFGLACGLLDERLAAQPRIAGLRDRLETQLVAHGARRNGPEGARVATASNLWFPGRRSDALVAALDVEGVAVSAGAACSSGKSEPSPVLLAMHPSEPARAGASIRFSFGPEVSDIQSENALNACLRVVSRPAA
ncbi:MAG: cysteine desulfurase family protein [Polyangiales bacterium]